ncbi:MAG: twin-arginine translocase TatA/TatE family subunit [Planctomycetaceae bacterium]|nr:twin-arginine translocase TatA/TatE family subunit [Planctomycetaceae bacterium]
MFTAIPAFLGIGAPGLPEMMIVGVIALLLFGKRLPEVARSLGKGIVEFKKGIRGVEDEVNNATYSSSHNYSHSSTETRRPLPDDDHDRQEMQAPRFEPPTSAPTDAEPAGTATAEHAGSEDRNA